MFTDTVWEIIHNRYSVGLDNKWHEGMSAGDWWRQSGQGDPDAGDENIMVDGPMSNWFQGFMEGLHHAYGGNSDFFDVHDERMWYDEWILPFDDPLKDPEVIESANAWTKKPREYFNSLRYYIESEAPTALFGPWDEAIIDDNQRMWAWTPPPKRKYHNAINKMVI